MPKPHPPYSYPGMPGDVTKDEITIYGENGVLWWRGLATEDDEAKVCAWAKTLQERLGVRRIIGGSYLRRCDKRRADRLPPQVIRLISKRSLVDAAERSW